MIIILPSSSVINQLCLLLHPVNTQYQNLSDLHLYSQSFDKTETNQMDIRIAFIFVSFLMTLVKTDDSLYDLKDVQLDEV